MFIDIDSLDFDDWKYREPFGPVQGPSHHFHDQVFVQDHRPSLLTKSMAFCEKRTHQQQKIQKIMNNSPVGANVSGTLEIVYKWGGEDGPSISGSLSGSVSDDKGNEVEANVQVESDGCAKVSISATHEDQPDS